MSLIDRLRRRVTGSPRTEIKLGGTYGKARADIHVLDAKDLSLSLEAGPAYGRSIRTLLVEGASAREQMAGRARNGVFICYRRCDSAGVAERLARELDARLNGAAVFVDVETIKGGEDWSKRIAAAIDNSFVMLVLIASTWQESFTDPHSYVSYEIRSAIDRRVVTIPVPIDDARLPPPEVLPAAFRELLNRQAVVLRHSSWEDDLKRLVEAIERQAAA